MGWVDNAGVRRAVGAFAAKPEQRTAIEVLRHCLYGELLFDTTGSTVVGPGHAPFQQGTELRIHYGAGPDGRRALFAFTDQHEIDRMYPPGIVTQSLATPATGALGLARQQGDAWLYINPAGPTCALSAPEMDFALRNPNNGALKVALAALAAGQCDRAAVLRLLRADGPLLIGADDSAADAPTMRTVRHPDGSVSLCGFTSGPEVLAFTPSDATASFTTGAVLDLVRRRGYRGLVINPAGPFVAFGVEELFV